MDAAITGPVGRRRFVELEQVCKEHVLHKHEHPHLFLVGRGRCRVTADYTKADGTPAHLELELDEGQDVTILAGVEHVIKPLTIPFMYHCIFSHRDFDGVVCETFIGNTSAYQ